jgi:putative FmdB family regulatory protein
MNECKNLFEESQVPIYEYNCGNCSTKFEKRRAMSQADSEIACPQCSDTHTRRSLSLFAAFSKSSNGGSQAVSGGGGCGHCGSHSCGSCKHH